MKRFIDILLSALGLIFLSPFFGLMALLIALDSRGGVFYHQPRLGRNGKTFDVIKFRTMYKNAEKILERELRLHPELRQEWDCYQKLKRDPRVTRVGGFLRRFSLDELPQLWNVLKGDMSLVGPRPLPCDESAACLDWQRRRLDVTPGLTCIWQVRGRSRVTFNEWVRMDLEYVQRRTFWQDFKILLTTVPAVLLRRGS